MNLSRNVVLASMATIALSVDMASAFATPQLSASVGQQQQQQQVLRLSTTSSTLSDQEVISDPMFIDTLDATTKKTLTDNDSKNSKSPDELITIAKRFLIGSKGLGGDPDMLADNFQFEGPVVGPLSKDAFVQAIGQVDFDTAFPDWTPQFYGFFVDPLEEEGNRVWYTARGRGTNKGPLLPFAPEPTGAEVVNPPQVCSLTIDHETGLITKYTIGYVVDRSVGNTGGLGGLYGILYAIGKPLPFPEAQPWKQSWQYAFFQKLGSLLNQ